jgi:hypothetical protein
VISERSNRAPFLWTEFGDSGQDLEQCESGKAFIFQEMIEQPLRFFVVPTCVEDITLIN